MAAVDVALAEDLSAGKLPRHIEELIATERYVEARSACAEDGRRAIQIVRENVDRFHIRADSVGMIGFSAGAFLVVDVALDPRAEQLAFISSLRRGDPGCSCSEHRTSSLQRRRPKRHPGQDRRSPPCRLVGGGPIIGTSCVARGEHGFGMIRRGLPSDG